MSYEWCHDGDPSGSPPAFNHGKSAQASLTVQAVQSRVARLGLEAKDVDEELSLYLKLTTLQECKEALLDIGPTPKIDATIAEIKSKIGIQSDKETPGKPAGGHVSVASESDGVSAFTPDSSSTSGSRADKNSIQGKAEILQPRIILRPGCEGLLLPSLPDNVNVLTTYIGRISSYEGSSCCATERRGPFFLSVRKYNMGRSGPAGPEQIRVQILCLSEDGEILEYRATEIGFTTRYKLHENIKRIEIFFEQDQYLLYLEVEFTSFMDYRIFTDFVTEELKDLPLASCSMG